MLERKLVADVRGIDATTHFEGCPPIAIIGKQLVIAVGFIPIVQAAMPLFILLLEWRAEGRVFCRRVIVLAFVIEEVAFVFDRVKENVCCEILEVWRVLRASVAQDLQCLDRDNRVNSRFYVSWEL